MTLLGRDVVEIDALVTDRYLDSLMTAGDRGPAHGVPGPAAGDRGPAHGVPGPAAPPNSEAPRPAGGRRIAWFSADRPHASGSDRLDRGVRLASERLTRDLPRFHPSFRFEERLAVRLAEAAAAMRLPIAAGGESAVRPVPSPIPELHPDFGPFGPDPEGHTVSHLTRPLLVGGAVAASALSLAGAAWVAWRHSRTSSSPMARAARAAHALRGRSAMRRRPPHALRGRPA